MKAIAVIPGQAGSIHLTELDEPSVRDVPNGRGVLVKVMRVGLCGTDREITAAEYGQAPEGYNFLVLGHECMGQVVEVGDAVSEFEPGDYVVPTVRRAGTSIYDDNGQYDMSTDDVYWERGINLLHGYLTEFFVEQPQYLVKVPRGLREVTVLLEPTAIIEKGIIQAYEIQRRLKIWKPSRVAILGAGPIGLLAAMSLRSRGLDVSCFGRRQGPNVNTELLNEIGARYISTTDMPVGEAAKTYGPFDLMFEATGSAAMVFDAMQHLGKNGVLVLSSVTGGGRDIQVPADTINLGFVLGNKVMVGTVNANRDYFEAGVYDLSRTEVQNPGWLSKLLTHKVAGLEDIDGVVKLLGQGSNAIKAYVEVSPL